VRGVKYSHGSSQRTADGARFAGTNRPSLGHTTSKMQFSGFSENASLYQLHWKWSLLSFTKRTLTAMAFGVALGLPSIPAFSDPAPSTPTLQSWTAAPLRRGDLVRLRSGGPLMTVENIKAVRWIAIGPTGMASLARKLSPSRCFRSSDHRPSARISH
jgi:hypothetical protein